MEQHSGKQGLEKLGPNDLLGKGADKLADLSRKFNNQQRGLEEDDIAGAVKEINRLKSEVRQMGRRSDILKK